MSQRHHVDDDDLIIHHQSIIKLVVTSCDSQLHRQFLQPEQLSDTVGVENALAH